MITSSITLGVKQIRTLTILFRLGVIEVNKHRQNICKTVLFHRFETWQNRVSGFFDKEEVPAAKFDIDKDAQIAHARIALSLIHI